MNQHTSFFTNKKTANMLLVMGLVFSAICYAVTIGWVAYLQTFVPVWEFQLLAAIVCTGVLIASIIAYKKKIKPREAVIISEAGVTDTINELSHGLIKWEDITDVSAKDEMVLIMVSNPEEYISRAKSIGMKRLLGSYVKKYGTSVLLNTSYLTCTAEELADALKSNFRK